MTESGAGGRRAGRSQPRERAATKDVEATFGFLRRHGFDVVDDGGFRELRWTVFGDGVRCIRIDEDLDARVASVSLGLQSGPPPAVVKGSPAVSQAQLVPLGKVAQAQDKDLLDRIMEADRIRHTSSRLRALTVEAVVFHVFAQEFLTDPTHFLSRYW